MQITFLISSLLNPLKIGLITKLESLLSASLLYKILTKSSNLLSILKEIIVVILLYIKEEVSFLYSKRHVKNYQLLEPPNF